MDLLKELLVEGKVDYINQRDHEKIHNAFNKDRSRHLVGSSLEVVQYFANHIGPKYLDWVVKQYCAGKFKLEDVNVVKDDLMLFERGKSQLTEKDIGRYTLGTLRRALRKFRDKDAITSGEKERKAKEGAKKLYEDDQVLIIELLTKEAAMYYGANTRWCTAAKRNNMFHEYNKEGSLIVLIDKQYGHKYQFHMESGQAMDEEDEYVEVADNLCVEYPMLEKVLRSTGRVDEVVDFLWFGKTGRIMGAIYWTKEELTANYNLYASDGVMDGDEHYRITAILQSGYTWDKNIDYDQLMEELDEQINKAPTHKLGYPRVGSPASKNEWKKRKRCFMEYHQIRDIDIWKAKDSENTHFNPTIYLILEKE